MSEGSYVISEVVAKTELQAHTIRYWEEQLGLLIERNNMGHRCYSDDDIRLFLEIKELKEKGYQLKAIKLALAEKGRLDHIDLQDIENLKEQMNQTKESDSEVAQDVLSIANNLMAGGEDVGRNDIVTSQSKEDKQEVYTNGSEKVDQFKEILHNIILESVKENNAEMAETITTTVTDNVVKEMDYLFRIKEEREEERFKKLDETIRDVQKSRQEVAVTGSKKKKGLFHKHK